MLIGILIVGAVLCLGYFAAIIVYSGLGTSASLIWLFAGLFLGGMAGSLSFYQRHPDRLPLWVPVSAVTLVISSLVVMVTVQALIYAHVPELAAPGIDYVIVLGAKVSEDELSQTLVKRLDKAAEYIRENPDTVLVLSGGQGADEPTSEARAMYDYLRAKGVPGQQMLMESASTSTMENILYSHRLIELDRESKKQTVGPPAIAETEVVLIAPDKPIQIGIITNNFHLFRARMIAKKQGIEYVSGIAAGSDPVLLVHMSVRECIAILKDRLVGNI